MKITMGNAQQAGTVQFGGPSEVDEAEHQARMTAAADAGVEIYGDVESRSVVQVASTDMANQNRASQVGDSLKLTAGGTANYEAILAAASESGDRGLITKYNAAIDEAVNGETEVQRANAHSRAESMLLAMRREAERLNGPKPGERDIHVMGG